MARKRDRDLIPRSYLGPNSLLKEMEKMFDDFRVDMEDIWTPWRKTPGSRVPPVDIIDAGEEYQVKVDLPGMNKDDVEIEIGKESLEIKASKETTEEEEGEGYIKRERGYYSFHRTLPLPENSDPGGVRALLRDGLLEVEIPKLEKKEEEKRKIKVE